MRRLVLVLALVLAGAHLPAGGQLPGGLLARPANLVVRGTTREAALRALQQSSGVPIAFSPDLLQTGDTVDCVCGDVTVGVALGRILEGSRLRYLEGSRQVLVGPATALPRARRPAAVTGSVVDGPHGRPVPGADVELLPGPRRAVTDGRGRFVVPDVSPGVYHLIVSALGYDAYASDATVPPAGLSVEIELQRQPIPLDEIVIAPGRIGVLDVAPAAMGSTVSRQDIEAIPEFGDDAFRTLQRFPGVTSEDVSTRLHVRGSDDRAVLVRLDGVELFEPYHLKEQDGALGIVDVQALGGIDLVTGGFSPEWGDHTAGVMDMTTRRAPPSGMRSTVGLSLSSLSFGNQGSFDHGRGQWLASVRRGFLDIVLRIAGVEDDLKPRYWDALGRVQYLVTQNHLVSLELLHAGDDGRWSDADDTGAYVSSIWSNGYAWGTWKADFAPRVHAETIVSGGHLDRDRTGGVSNPSAGVFTPLAGRLRDEAGFDVGGVRQDWRVALTSALLLKAGWELRRTTGTYDFASDATFHDLDPAGHVVDRVDSVVVGEEVRSTWTAAYLSARAKLGGSVSGEAGLRYDHHTHTGDESVTPRALLRWDVGPRTTLRASWGDYSQTQGVHELSVADSQTVFSPAERARQTAIGVEQELGYGLTGRLEAYVREVRDPQPFFVNLSREVNPLPELSADRRRVDPTRSRARGLELLLTGRDGGPFAWSLSYVLAKAEDEIGGVWVPRTLDQRHTLNLMAEYRGWLGWRLSGLFQYHSGWPVTDQRFDVAVTPDVDGRGNRVTLVRREFGPMNAQHLPSYQRLDLRFTRAFDLRRGRLELFLDVFNVFDRANLKGYEYSLRMNAAGDRLTARREDGDPQLPRLPTLGFRWMF